MELEDFIDALQSDIPAEELLARGYSVAGTWDEIDDPVLIGPDDPDLAAVQAAIHVGFGQDDTEIGVASVADRDAQVAERGGTEVLRETLAAGRSVLFGAFDPDLGPLGGGSHNPWGEKIIAQTVHTPGSPVIGFRKWPKV